MEIQAQFGNNNFNYDADSGDFCPYWDRSHKPTVVCHDLVIGFGEISKKWPINKFDIGSLDTGGGILFLQRHETGDSPVDVSNGWLCCLERVG